MCDELDLIRILNQGRGNEMQHNSRSVSRRSTAPPRNVSWSTEDRHNCHETKHLQSLWKAQGSRPDYDFHRRYVLTPILPVGQISICEICFRFLAKCVVSCGPITGESLRAHSAYGSHSACLTKFSGDSMLATRPLGSVIHATGIFFLTPIDGTETCIKTDSSKWTQLPAADSHRSRRRFPDAR